MTVRRPAERALIRLLGQRGALSGPDVARLTARAEESDRPLPELVEEEGRITGAALAELLADALRLPAVDLARTPAEPEAVEDVPEAAADTASDTADETA